MTCTATSPREKSHLESEQVRKAIAKVLRKYKVDSQRIGDLTQDVIALAWQVQPPPTTLRRWIGLVKKMAKQRAIDDARAQITRRAHDVGLCETPDAHASEGRNGSAAEAIDRKRKLDFVLRETQRGGRRGRAAMMLVMRAGGEEYEDIAKEFRVKLQTVRNMVLWARRQIGPSWQRYTATGILLALGLVIWVGRPQKVIVGQPPAEPSKRHDAVEPTPVDRARELRRRALHDCDVARWDECVRGLDEAATLDPAGDANPAVQRARTRAASHLPEHPASPAP